MKKMHLKVSKLGEYIANPCDYRLFLETSTGSGQRGGDDSKDSDDFFVVRGHAWEEYVTDYIAENVKTGSFRSNFKDTEGLNETKVLKDEDTEEFCKWLIQHRGELPFYLVQQEFTPVTPKNTLYEWGHAIPDLIYAYEKDNKIHLMIGDIKSHNHAKPADKIQVSAYAKLLDELLPKDLTEKCAICVDQDYGFIIYGPKEEPDIFEGYEEGSGADYEKRIKRHCKGIWNGDDEVKELLGKLVSRRKHAENGVEAESGEEGPTADARFLLSPWQDMLKDFLSRLGRMEDRIAGQIENGAGKRLAGESLDRIFGPSCDDCKKEGRDTEKEITNKSACIEYCINNKQGLLLYPELPARAQKYLLEQDDMEKTPTALLELIDTERDAEKKIYKRFIENNSVWNRICWFEKGSLRALSAALRENSENRDSRNVAEVPALTGAYSVVMRKPGSKGNDINLFITLDYDPRTRGIKKKEREFIKDLDKTLRNYHDHRVQAFMLTKKEKGDLADLLFRHIDDPERIVDENSDGRKIETCGEKVERILKWLQPDERIVDKGIERSAASLCVIDETLKRLFYIPALVSYDIESIAKAFNVKNDTDKAQTAEERFREKLKCESRIVTRVISRLSMENQLLEQDQNDSPNMYKENSDENAQGAEADHLPQSAAARFLQKLICQNRYERFIKDDEYTNRRYDRLERAIANGTIESYGFPGIRAASLRRIPNIRYLWDADADVRDEILRQIINTGFAVSDNGNEVISFLTRDSSRGTSSERYSLSDYDTLREENDLIVRIIEDILKDNCKRGTFLRGTPRKGFYGENSVKLSIEKGDIIDRETRQKIGKDCSLVRVSIGSRIAFKYLVQPFSQKGGYLDRFMYLPPVNNRKFSDKRVEGIKSIKDTVEGLELTERFIESFPRVNDAPEEDNRLWFMPDPFELEKYRDNNGDYADEDNHSFTESQSKILENVYTKKHTLVLGPPGTGKSDFISRVIYAFSIDYRNALPAGNSKPSFLVLVSSNSHIAINNVLSKTFEKCDDADVEIYKVESIEGSNPSGKNEGDGNGDHDIEIMEGKVEYTEGENVAKGKNVDFYGYGRTPGFEKVSEINGLQNHLVVIGATGFSAAKYLSELRFDLIVIDESTQVSMMGAVPALCCAKDTAHYLVAGDDNQLSTIIQGDYSSLRHNALRHNKPFIYGSVYEYFKTNGIKPLKLEENFRMNEVLNAYLQEVPEYGTEYRPFDESKAKQQLSIREETYSELLNRIAGPEPENSERVVWDMILNPKRPVVLCLLKGARPGELTDLEAKLVERVICYLKKLPKKCSQRLFWKEKCGIIIPTHKHIERVKELLNDPEAFVGTVDKLQGQERDVIVSSYGIADQDEALRGAEFYYNRNRFIVSISRAKKKLIVIMSEAIANRPTEIFSITDKGVQSGIDYLCGLKDFLKAKGKEGADWMLNVPVPVHAEGDETEATMDIYTLEMKDTDT